MSDKPSYQSRVTYQSALLGGVATLSAILLLLANITTKDAIAQRHAEDMQKSLLQVVPSGLHDNNLLDNQISIQYQGKVINVYRGTKNNTITALAYQISGNGYGGEIQLLMSVDSKGDILGVRVLSHSETPGLGDKIEAEKTPWILSFNGLSLTNTEDSKWAVKKDGGIFDQFSGATITPRGVVKAVKTGLDFFQDNKSELLAYSSKQTGTVSKPTHKDK